MSADNAYFVIEKDGEFSVAHGFMSGDDPGYMASLFESGSKFSTREEALVYAHDKVKETDVVEYGVVEVGLYKDFNYLK